MANSIRTSNSLITGRTSRGKGRLKSEYARHAPPPAIKRIPYSRRGVALWGGLLLLVLLPLFAGLGIWQLRKAEDRFGRQAELEARSRGAPAAMPEQPAAAGELRYRRFVLRGEYESESQFLVDNRVHAGRAGYHVVTPLRLAGSTTRVLVNRGWIPAGQRRAELPGAAPPSGLVEITGIAVVPPERFFTLGAGEPGPVWQNLDIARFRAGASYPLQPAVIQLDPAAPGGYLREWPRPDENAGRNLGYAVQWFGGALASLGIWLHFLLRRR